MSMLQRFENGDAKSVLYDHAETWEWMIKGYCRDTDIIILQDVVIETNPIPDISAGRFLLCRHPTYLFYGEMYSLGRGYILREEADIIKLFTALRPFPITECKYLLALCNSSRMVTAVMQCQAYTLYV